MTRFALYFAAFAFSQQMFAQCPDFIDHSMRELHSKSSVNLCERFANKPLLIVNTASHCGFTPQFKGLEAIHQRYKSRGLAVVGFASNDFNQEASDEAKAARICYVNNGVTFTMLAPSKVSGNEANPIFRELAKRTQAPDWNFNKYLVSRNGEIIQRFGSRITPENAELIDAIEELL